MTDQIATNAQITGRVQGVSFRAWTQQQANTHGLAGWVQNEADGTVRAWIEGSAERVQAMLTKLHDGPPAAHVDRVTSTNAAPQGFETFEIRR